jgi:hypothetical protein
VDNGVDIVLPDASQDRSLVVDISEHEREIVAVVKTFGVVQSCAIVDFVKGDNMVGFGIGKSKVPDYPRCSFAEASADAVLVSQDCPNLHETCATCDHNIANIEVRIMPNRAFEYRRSNSIVAIAVRVTV